MQQLITDLDGFGGHLFGANGYLAKLDILFAALFGFADHDAFISGAVSSHPGDGLPAIGLKHSGDIGHPAKCRH
ncbi:hypothetical protein D3C85_1762890 [compost metagenome]